MLAKARANGYERATRLTLDELRGASRASDRAPPGPSPSRTNGSSAPGSTSIAFATEAVGAGVELRLGTAVTGVTRDLDTDSWLVHTSEGPVRTDWVINAAGLFSDQVNHWFGHDEFTIAPRRGQLIVFDKLARPLVSSIVLPVPTQRTKGVLVAPTVYGNVLLGPTAEDIDDREDTVTTALGLKGLLDAGRRILPELVSDEVTATYAGVRAATEHQDYQITIHADERYVCVGGIRSTGLTASLAIAEHVAGQMGAAGLSLAEADAEPVIPRMPELGELGVRAFADAEQGAGRSGLRAHRVLLRAGHRG